MLHKRSCSVKAAAQILHTDTRELICQIRQVFVNAVFTKFISNLWCLTWTVYSGVYSELCKTSKIACFNWKSKRLKAANKFCKTFHLRCLTGFTLSRYKLIFFMLNDRNKYKWSEETMRYKFSYISLSR